MVSVAKAIPQSVLSVPFVASASPPLRSPLPPIATRPRTRPGHNRVDSFLRPLSQIFTVAQILFSEDAPDPLWASHRPALFDFLVVSEPH